jgi:TQXA domain-containing protein
MITTQRQRGRRRAAAAVASLAIAAGLVGALAAPSGAASEAEYTGPKDGHTALVEGTVGEDEYSHEAGLFDLVIDGEVDSSAYCIDFNTSLPDLEDGPVVLDEIEWDTSGVTNLAIVEAILANYHPNGVGPAGYQISGDNGQKAAATQAAIWHYTDEFDLSTETPGENPDADDDAYYAQIVANYNKILAAVEADAIEGFGEPGVTLSIDSPDSTEGAAGELVGPYTTNTSAASVTLTPSEGVSLHNQDGSPFTGAVVDGTKVWLSSEAEGTGTIDVTAAATIGAGRVFFKQGVQRLVLASNVTTNASAQASVTFHAGPPQSTTSSSVPEETTTTVPITPQTTVLNTTTTAVPAQPASNTGGGLPVTGAQTLVLVGLALVLVVIGAGFGIVSRRKRLGG